MKSLFKVTLLSSTMALVFLSPSVFAATTTTATSASTAVTPVTTTKAATTAATPATAATATAATPATTAKAATPAVVKLTPEEAKKESYALGASFGSYITDSFSSQQVDFNKNSVIEGFTDGVNGKLKMSQKQIQDAMNNFQNRLMAQEQEKEKTEAAANTKAGDAYRANFVKQSGVKQTKDGLLYKIVKSGDATRATDKSSVEVQYTGKLINGKEFDNSAWHGKTTTVALSDVIPGWQEGLKLIGAGGEIQLVIPPSLAYGSNNIPGNDKSVGIPPESTLVFDIKLVKIDN